MKRFFTVITALCLCTVLLTTAALPAFAADTIDFCGITLETEAGAHYFDYDFLLEPMEDTWVAGTEEYLGVDDYIMSTNCDENSDENEEFIDTTYAVSFTMPYNGFVTFKAYVSGEEYYDHLVVLIDSNVAYTTQNIYWDNSWIDVSVMAKKDQRISICYTKDYSVWQYEDRAYIADLALEELNITFSDEIADTSWYDEEETEFEISTKEELAGFSVLVNSGVTFEECTIKLTDDIDMSGVIWVPAGQYNLDLYYYNYDPENEDSLLGLNTYFSGIFDGQGYSISNLLCKYTYPQTTYIGFVAINFGTIMNLELINPVIGDGDIAKSAGAVAGYNGGLIDRCAVIGGNIDITWDRYFIAYAGGLVGTNGYAFTFPFFTELNNPGGIINQCYSSADVQVDYTRSGFFGGPGDETEAYISAAGGLLGAAYGGIVMDCYASGNVHAIARIPEDSEEEDIEDTYALSGGFIGMVLSSLPEYLFGNEEAEYDVSALFVNCYATGTVTAIGPAPARSIKSGFVGFARNMSSYQENPLYLMEAQNCFFDTEATGRTNGFKLQAQFEGVTGKTSAEMKDIETFTEWNFDGIWSIYNDTINNGYPVIAGVGEGYVYTVIYKDYNDTVIKTEYIYDMEEAAPPADPVREGYVFTGWDPDFDFENRIIIARAMYNIVKLENNDVTVEGIDDTSMDPDTQLEANIITDTLSQTLLNDYNFKINGISEGKELVDLLSIRLLLNDEPVQPNGSVRVRIKLTEAQLAYTDLELVYIDNEGNITSVSCTIENGYLIFETDHFSNYAIIGVQPDPTQSPDPTDTAAPTDTTAPTNTPSSPDTGEASMLFPTILLLTAAFAIVYILRRKLQSAK